MSTPQWDPSVHKRRLQRALRSARESTELTQQQVAIEMDWSASKVIRIEAGTVTVTSNDLRALLNLYGIHESDRVAELMDSARLSRAKSPLDKYKPYLSPHFISYLAYETSASTIRNFEPLLVPGLLQTDEYATETFQASRGPQHNSRIASLVDLRLDRQRRLIDKEGLEFFFMLDESVIRRPVATIDALRRQLDHILVQIERPNVHVHVVPFAAGIYRSIRVPYVVLEFADIHQSPVLFREYPERDEIMVGDDRDVTDETPRGEPAVTPSTYLEIFMELENRAPNKASEALIRDARSAL
jgi:transcriptional regulator with XRE-family HTH domain